MENRNISVKKLVDDFNARLSEIYNAGEISQILYMLFDEYLQWTKTRVHLLYSEEIPEAALALFNRALSDLLQGRPVQYILGKAWFNGSLLHVGPGVLIPRPETEELCEIIGATLAGSTGMPLSILDVGTGSGCIAIDLKKRFPQAVVTAVDASSGALEIARANATANQAEINFIQADILGDTRLTVPGSFSVIVSNPPYVTESEKPAMNRNVTDFEPAMALFVTDGDPLQFYRVITGFAADRLASPGYLFFEINERFGMEVRNLGCSCGFSQVEILQDIHGKDRFVKTNR